MKTGLTRNRAIIGGGIAVVVAILVIGLANAAGFIDIDMESLSTAENHNTSRSHKTLSLVNAELHRPPAAGQVRYSGVINDMATGAPIAGVCVYADRATGCPAGSLMTDAQGRWVTDLPASWKGSFNFEHSSYQTLAGRYWQRGSEDLDRAAAITVTAITVTAQYPGARIVSTTLKKK